MVDIAEPTQVRLLPDEPVEITMGEIETTALDHEEVQEAAPGLVQSIAQIGILQPLLVRHNAEGTFRLIDGRRRLDAARKAGLAKIPVAVVTAGEVVADTMTISANALRRANIVAEVEAIHRLAQRGASEKEIFAATRMPVQTIRKRLQLLKLVPELMDAFREGRMAPSVAEDAAKLPEAAQQRLIEDVDEHGKLTAKDVQSVRAARQREAAGQLPDSLFDMEDLGRPRGERAGEPVEAQLARELQDIISRLPSHANAQGVVRHSIAFAAENLMDIATGCYAPTEFEMRIGDAAIPVKVNYAMPKDEIWLEQGGKVVGKIVNNGVEEEPSQEEYEPVQDLDPYPDDVEQGRIEREEIDERAGRRIWDDDERDYGDALDGSYTG